jgi:hypothetical protein
MKTNGVKTMNTKLSVTQLHRAAHAMYERGKDWGTGKRAFEAAIANVFFTADRPNRERLLAAFGDLFERAHRLYVKPGE